MARRFLHHSRRGLMSLFALTLGLVLILQSCTTTPSASSPSPDAFTERMSKEHQGDQPIATEAATQKPAVEVTSTMVKYATVNGQTVQGFLSQPVASDKPLPAIIAIHEWWGLNDNIKAVTERLAGEGYSVLAVDLYGGQVATQPDQAKQLMQSVMQDTEPAKDNLRQAYEYLVKEQQAPKIGSIGWCFGGAWSLNTGLLLPTKLNALVIYYGKLETNPEILAPLQMPIA
ncbi:MAG: dienelactone hydrolase family protein, partial [Thermosynechococcaceae cyanobacterium]